MLLHHHSTESQLRAYQLDITNKNMGVFLRLVQITNIELFSKRKESKWKEVVWHILLLAFSELYRDWWPSFNLLTCNLNWRKWTLVIDKATGLHNYISDRCVLIIAFPNGCTNHILESQPLLNGLCQALFRDYGLDFPLWPVI